MDWTLTPTRIVAGTWEGLLTGPGDTPPVLQARHLDDPLNSLTIKQVEGGWLVCLAIPPDVISEGVQTFLICNEDGVTLASFALVAGDALAQDLRAEVDLLRAELDMLKRAFRRHCVETA